MQSLGKYRLDAHCYSGSHVGCAILGNIWYDMPALGVWLAILLGALVRKMPWDEVKVLPSKGYYFPLFGNGSFFDVSLKHCRQLHG